MKQINAIEINKTLPRAQEAIDKLIKLFGPTKCITIYDESCMPRIWKGQISPEFGCIPTKEAITRMRFAVDGLLDDKNATSIDSVMFDFEFTSTDYAWAEPVQKEQWLRYKISQGAWEAFKAVWQPSTLVKSYNDACIEIYQAAVMQAGLECCFYNVAPGGKPGNKQWDRWAKLVSRHTQPIYPVTHMGVPRRVTISTEAKNPTLIQCPLFIHHQSTHQGIALMSSDIFASIDLAGRSKMDLMWYGAFNKAEEVEALLGSGFFETVKENL